MTASALMSLPLALFTLPEAVPSAETVVSMVVLGAGGTGIAFLLFYGLIADVGPAKASVVAYIAPAFSVLYGSLILDEPFTVGTIGGLALILAGSYLAAGGAALRRAQRRPATAGA
jgi:drug/metabolite transporter (DMT)-like permease